MEYRDKTVRKVITPSLLNKMTIRSFFCQEAFNMERMQAAGWLYTILPGLEAIHQDKEDLKESMKMHMEFFNTHPLLITFIAGLVVAMEENKESIENIRSVRVSTMGPLGGIGDSLFWLTFLTIASSLGASLALQGSIAGPIVFLLIFNAMQFALKFGFMYYGYNTGVKSMAALQKNTAKFTRAINILGLTVIGSMIATFGGLSLKLGYKYKEFKEAAAGGFEEVEKYMDFGAQLDKVMPRLLPVLYTFLMLYLIKKKVSPVYLVFITLIAGVLGHVAGVI